MRIDVPTLGADRSAGTKARATSFLHSHGCAARPRTTQAQEESAMTRLLTTVAVSALMLSVAAPGLRAADAPSTGASQSGGAAPTMQAPVNQAQTTQTLAAPAPAAQAPTTQAQSTPAQSP